MNMNRCVKDSFVVIGKEGSVTENSDVIQQLWTYSNSHFEEIRHLAKKDENGDIAGIWGAMTDFSRAFNPWEDFSRGLYLAGVECESNAEVPDGWTMWTIPGYEYIYAECENQDTFSNVLQYLEENNIPLAGAVQDFTCPQTGKNYMFFRLESCRNRYLVRIIKGGQFGMNICCRIATSNDIEKMSRQIAYSYVSAYKNLMSAKYLSSLSADHWIPILEDSIQRGDVFLVAEERGDIAGSSIFGIADKNEMAAEWHAFYLQPNYIGKGIGHLLYQETETEMKKSGCSSCILEVLSNNERAINFYLAHGFTKLDTFLVHENGMILSCDKMIKTLNK